LKVPRTQVFVNDVKVTDYTEGQPVPPKKLSFEPDRGPRPDKGWIGLQNHSDKDIVYFKTVASAGVRHRAGLYPLAGRAKSGARLLGVPQLAENNLQRARENKIVRISHEHISSLIPQNSTPLDSQAGDSDSWNPTSREKRARWNSYNLVLTHPLKPLRDDGCHMPS
jgi:hypothetical protein